MSRYYDAPPTVKRQVSKVMKSNFPNLLKVEIRSIFDTKKKKTQGKYRLAETKKANDIEKFLVKQADNEVDCFIIFDEGLVTNIEKRDLDRLIFHELNHIRVEEDGMKLIPHDFEGFYAEIEYNKDDPAWKDRFTAVMEEIYESE